MMDWNKYFEYCPNNGLLRWRPRPESDFINKSQYKRWGTKFVGQPPGSMYPTGYVSIKLYGKPHLAHRIIWQMNHGEIPDGFQIDHINGNPRDNRISNLRLATHTENTRNRKLSKYNTSGYKGVSHSPVGKRWRSRIRIGTKRIGLGSYDNIEDAAAAYAEAAKRYHGEFAR